MIKVNVAEAKARFSAYLETVEAGETVVVCRRNVPIAEIRALPRRSQQPRPLGIDRGMVVPASFFEPLPAALLDAFGFDAGLPNRPLSRIGALVVAAGDFSGGAPRGTPRKTTRRGTDAI